MIYVLLGGPFQIMDTPLSGEPHLLKCALGARFEIDQPLAEGAIRHGAMIVPEEVYATYGFTPEDEKRHPNARLHATASAEFKAKYAAAIQAFQEFRAQLAPKG